MPSLEKKTGLWRARWYQNGNRCSKSGFTSKKNALLFERQQKTKQYCRLVGREVKDETDIEPLFDDFLKYCQLMKKRSGTIRRDQGSLKQWRLFLAESNIHKVFQINQRVVSDFVKWRSYRRTPRNVYPSARTINLDLVTLRLVFKWAEEYGRIEKFPVKKFPLLPQEKPGQPRYLSLEEIRLIESRAGQIKEAIQILLRTGVRSNELCTLTKFDVNLQQSFFQIRAEIAKNKEARSVFFDKKAKVILEKLIGEARVNNRDYLFCTGTGSRQSPRNLNRRFRTLLRGLEKEGLIEKQHEIKIHSLRKTFISHKFMSGEDPQRVMAIVGHKDFTTTKRYLALHPEYNKMQKQLPY